MRAREDRRSRLALQLLDRDQRIGSAAQARRPLLDERPHERAVLVQRRPARVLVLDERHRQLGPVVELTEQEREGAEGEAAESKLELRSANGHASGYGAPCPNPVCRRFWLLLAALFGLVPETLDLGSVALDPLGAVEQLRDAVAVAGRDPGDGEVVQGVRLRQGAGALECGDGTLENRQCGARVAGLEQPEPLVVEGGSARGRRGGDRRCTLCSRPEESRAAPRPSRCAPAAPRPPSPS